MQLLFSFDQDVRVQKTLIQTLACQLSCNSCSRLTRTVKLENLSYKLWFVNSHQLSCNSCSRLTRTLELEKLSYKLLFFNSRQLSCNSCSRLTRTSELRTVIQTLARQPSRSRSTRIRFSLLKRIAKFEQLELLFVNIDKPFLTDQKI